jgi:hypothetical protein
VERQNKTSFNFAFSECSQSSTQVKDTANEWKGKIKQVLIFPFSESSLFSTHIIGSVYE